MKAILEKISAYHIFSYLLTGLLFVSLGERLTSFFRDELIQALDDPEIQKTAISGLIQEIVVHPTAALDIQCSFKTCFQTIALQGIDPKPSYPDTPTSLFHPHAAAIAEPHNPSLF